MTIIYPRAIASFADVLPISSIVWRVQRADEFAGLGSSQSIPIEMADPLWAADITLDKDKWPDARKVSARLNSLEGSIRDFYLFNPSARWPAADPHGVVLGARTVTIASIGADRDSVGFAGLPSGYKLTEGDFFSVDFSSAPVRRGAFQLLEDVTAGAGGTTAAVRVFPHVWPGITSGLTVTLIDPSAKFFVAPNTLKMGAIRHAIVDGATFSVLQRL